MLEIQQEMEGNPQRLLIQLGLLLNPFHSWSPRTIISTPMMQALSFGSCFDFGHEGTDVDTVLGRLYPTRA